MGKIKRFGDLAAYCGFYFTDTFKIDPATAAQEFSAESKALLAELRNAYAQLADFTATNLEVTLKIVAKEQLKVKAGLLIHPTRLACTGSTAGPSLYHLMEILGKERVLKRLDSAMTL